jgi:hypothetical protein
MKDFKNYKRFPIQLSAQNIMLIHLFSDRDITKIFESHDMTEENQAAFEYSWKESEMAAKQLFDQLEGHYCDAFLEAVIVEAAKMLAKSDKSNNASNKKYEESSLGKSSPMKCVKGPQNRMKKALDKAEVEAKKI